MIGFTEDLTCYESFVNEQEILNNFKTDLDLRWLVQAAEKSIKEFRKLVRRQLYASTAFKLMENSVKKDVINRLYLFLVGKVLKFNYGFGYYIVFGNSVVLDFWSQSEDINPRWCLLGQIYYTGYCTREEHEFKVNNRQFVSESSN